MGSSIDRSTLRGHMIVCGDDALAQRISQELAEVFGQHVTIVLPSLRGGVRGPQIAELVNSPHMTVEAVEALVPDDDALRRAGIENASALALTGGDDQFNISVALRARRLNPGLRLVVRMYNPTLGKYVEGLLDKAAEVNGPQQDGSQGRDALDAATTVLSDADTAAPSLAAAAVVGQDKILQADGLLMRAKERNLGSAERRNPLCTLALLPHNADDDEGWVDEEREAEAAAAAGDGHDGTDASATTATASADETAASVPAEPAGPARTAVGVPGQGRAHGTGSGRTASGHTYPGRTVRAPHHARHVLLPSAEELAGLPPNRRAIVLEAIERPRPRRNPRPRKLFRRLLLKELFSRRLRYTLLAMAVALLVLATLLWVVSLHAGHGSWWDSAYQTLLNVFAINDPVAHEKSGHLPIAQAVLQLVSALAGMALLPLFLAVVLESYGAFRKAASLLDPPRGLSKHVVLLGLGKVGTRVLARLLEMGNIDVVCIERDPEARGIALARQHNVPTLIADVTQDGVLIDAKIKRSSALLALTSNDGTNLEASLYARQVRPELRVVLRLFDDAFASTVYDTLRDTYPAAQTRSRSVSALAAPAFAGAMMGRQVLGAIPVGRRVLVFASVNVSGNRHLEGRRVAEAFRPEAWRVVALDVAQHGRRSADLSSVPPTQSGELDWRLSPDRVLTAGDRVVVAATRRGLSRLLAANPDAGTPAIPGTGEHTLPLALRHPAPEAAREPAQGHAQEPGQEPRQGSVRSDAGEPAGETATPAPTPASSAAPPPVTEPLTAPDADSPDDGFVESRRTTRLGRRDGPRPPRQEE